MSDIVRMEAWCTRPINPNPYLPPEVRGLCLSGRVYGHPKFPDGHEVDTTQIIAVNGRAITVKSGRVYHLGQPSRAWLRWLRETGKPYDPKRPIKDLREKGGPS